MPLAISYWLGAWCCSPQCNASTNDLEVARRRSQNLSLAGNNCISKRVRQLSVMASSSMIRSSKNGVTFMYRVGGIAVSHGCLLVEHNNRHNFCFLPDGRVEHGENTIAALAREIREEISEEAIIGRLVIVSDNLFELDNERYQEVVLYFLIAFMPGSKVLSRDDAFNGNEPDTFSQWIPLDQVRKFNLVPSFLRERAIAIPNIPEYIIRDDIGLFPVDQSLSDV